MPYAGWIQAGHLIEAGDKIIHYDAIFDVIVRSTKDFNVQTASCTTAPTPCSPGARRT